MKELLEEDDKDIEADSSGSQKKSKQKKAGVQGTASVCNTVPDVCGDIQIWVKNLMDKTITLELVLQVESSDTIDMVKSMIRNTGQGGHSPLINSASSLWASSCSRTDARSPTTTSRRS
jgi:hypothetical protein